MTVRFSVNRNGAPLARERRREGEAIMSALRLTSAAAGAMAVLAAAPGAATAAVRLPIPDIGWGSARCTNSWIEVRKQTGIINAVWAEMHGECTARARVRVELSGPGFNKPPIDGYLQPGSNSQSMWAFFASGTWTACASYRNNDWSLIPGTRICPGEYYK